MDPGGRITRQIIRMPREVALRLERWPGATGRVQSVFARAINIEWSDGEWGNGGLLALHGPGPLLAPFAAAVDPIRSLGELRVGTPVTIESRRLRAGALVVSWAEAEMVDCSADARSPAPTPHLFETPGRHASSLDSRPGVAARAQLAAAIRDRDAGRLVEGARALLGLGEGLTPAGDDCLVGALAVLHHTAAAWPSIGSPDLAPIAAAARERTTTIGREFVLHALAGRYSEPVLAVLRAASRGEATRAVSRLLALGATSGADTLSGMRLACRALAA